MSENESIQEIKEITGIGNLKTLKAKDALKILELVGENKIKQKNIGALIEMFPHVTNIFSESISMLRETIKSNSENQTEMIRGATTVFENTSQVLSILAKSADSDETKLLIVNTIMNAGDRYHTLINELKEINKDNLKTAKINMITTIGGGLLSLLGGLSYLSSNSDSNNYYNSDSDNDNDSDCDTCIHYNCPCYDCDDDCEGCSYENLSCEELVSGIEDDESDW